MDTLLSLEDPSLQEVLGLWSPPDSGSETPYSPPDEDNCKITSSSNDSSPEMLSHHPHPGTAGSASPPHLQHPSQLVHQTHGHLHQQQPHGHPSHHVHPPALHPVIHNHLAQLHPHELAGLQGHLALQPNPHQASLDSNGPNSGPSGTNLMQQQQQQQQQPQQQPQQVSILNGTHNSIQTHLHHSTGVLTVAQMAQTTGHHLTHAMTHSVVSTGHHLGSPTAVGQQQQPPPHYATASDEYIQTSNASNVTGSPPNLSGNKKRKASDSVARNASTSQSNSMVDHSVLSSGVIHIKRDPSDRNMSPVEAALMSTCEEDYGFNYGATGGGGPCSEAGGNPPSVYGLGPEYQCIRFSEFLKQNWHPLLDASMNEVTINYRVDADKGFNFSNPDDAFVCQKKNHFQVTVHVQPMGTPKYVKTPEGPKKVDQFYLHFYGCKTESPTQVIKVEQSQSDRSKKAFHPQPIELIPEQVSKTTVGRLHFSETTSNNMRKKGKPNPDQRFFNLVVTLAAHVGHEVFHVISHASERIIVRASNPGQFENDLELTWQKGTTPESVYHAGRVGINTDRPDEPLVVHGNVKVTGHIIQPSDERVKEQIEELDTKQQLRNVSNMRIVKYNFKSEFGQEVGLAGENLNGTGVIAQEVQRILPDAVKPAGDMLLATGDKIENFLVVNNDRIFMENVGAVKELCKVTDNLETRIDELERMNNKLRKINRFDSIKSVVSSSSVASTITTSACRSCSSSNHHHHSSKEVKSCRRCSYTNGGHLLVHANASYNRTHYHSHPHHMSHHLSHPNSAGDSNEFCSNRFMQSIIMILVLVMAFCLASMATLYILEYHKRHTIHPHLAIGPHVGSTVVGTTGPGSGPYQYYNPTIYNHPNGSQMHPNPSQYSTGHMPHHPPPGQNAFDFATPAGQATVPIMNLAPPSVVDSKGHSNNNAISSISSQEKVPSSNRDKSQSNSGQESKMARPYTVAASVSRSTISASSNRMSNSVPTPAMNPFNDLADGGKGIQSVAGTPIGHEKSEDLSVVPEGPVATFANKSVSNGLSNAVSVHPDKQGTHDSEPGV